MSLLHFAEVKLFFIAELAFLPNFAVGKNTFFMRKFILLLLLALLSVSNPIYAKGEEIIKIEIIDNTKPGTKTNRIPAKPQVECYFYSAFKCLELLFLSNMGAAMVSLENQTTGEIHSYVGNSASGRMVISVESASAYRMDITTENAHSYHAVFFTDDESEE